MSSESDSDAPEELTLSQSKNMEKERLKGQRHAALEEESKKKEKRRRINERNIKQKQEADFIKLVQDEPEQEEQEDQEEQEEQEKDDDEKRKKRKRKRRKKNDKVLETETKVYNVIAINDDKLTKLTMKRFNPEGKSKFNNFKNEMLYGKKNKRTKSDQIIASFAKRSVR